MKEELLLPGAALGLGFLVTLLGGWDSALEVLSVFIVMDYLTGVAAAIKTRTLSSMVGFMGVMRKALIFLVVILAVQVDRVAGTVGMFRTSVTFFFIGNEGISILENVQELGLRLPDFLTETLLKLRDKHTDVGGTDSTDSTSKEASRSAEKKDKKHK